MNLPEHRKAIDKLDAQIVRLLNERTQHVLAIGEIKLKAGDRDCFRVSLLHYRDSGEFVRSNRSSWLC